MNWQYDVHDYCMPPGTLIIDANALLVSLYLVICSNIKFILHLNI
jgi:hypothetical protein